VTIAAGRTEITINLPVNDDGDVEGNETVIATLGTTLVSGDSQIAVNTTPAQLNIIDDEAITVDITASTATGFEQGTVPGQFTVTLSRQGTSQTVVNYTVGGGTAGAGDHGLGTSGAVTFTVGQTVATISVPVTDDSIVEADETVVVGLGTLVNTGELVRAGTSNQATVTIKDNDTSLVKIGARGSLDFRDRPRFDECHHFSDQGDRYPAGGDLHHRGHGDQWQRLRHADRHGHHPGQCDHFHDPSERAQRLVDRRQRDGRHHPGQHCLHARWPDQSISIQRTR